MSFVVIILVSAVNVERKLAFGAGVDVIAAAGIPFSVSVFAADTGVWVDGCMTERLSTHCLASTIAALAMRLAFVPTVLQFILG